MQAQQSQEHNKRNLLEAVCFDVTELLAGPKDPAVVSKLVEKSMEYAKAVALLLPDDSTALPRSRQPSRRSLVYLRHLRASLNPMELLILDAAVLSGGDLDRLVARLRDTIEMPEPDQIDENEVLESQEVPSYAIH